MNITPLSQEEKDKIAKTLSDKHALLPCPRCGNNNFSLADGYINSPLQYNLNGFALGGPSIPAAVVICTNCGFISQHALGVIGALAKPLTQQHGE
ncbi:MAG: hypothetical protein K2X04_10045 [Burkholderiales bacterium]|jgi:hypothetical protein|nr:hypothetical protein [Burkholderiales bacterium]